MITTGSKLYFGLGALCVVGAAVYGFGNTGGLNGVLSLGFNGGVGEHTGYVLLLLAGAALLFFGGVVVAVRDADADAVVAAGGLEELPDVPRAQGASYWPAVAALAAALAVVGLVINTQLFLLGIVIGVVALLEWMVRAWSERATGDAAANQRIRNRLMYPFEIPVFGAFGIFFVVFSLSRLLLALSKNGSAIAAIVIAVVILGTATVLSAAPKVGKTVLGLVCVVGALGVLAAGIISAAHGERNFGGEEHEVQFTPADRNQPPDAALVPHEEPAPTPDTASAN